MRGAHNIVFYSLPEYAHFYPELVNLLEDGDGSGSGSGSGTSCLTLFTQYERMALERLVGAARAAHMLASKKHTFMFC
jgi:U3 small nucleolar RNA-associated protein 25